MTAASTDSPSQLSRTAVVAVATLAALYVAHALVIGYVSDDGYIALRYVRNILLGNGPVFNPGERVEGYTSFLWVTLLALAGRLLPGADLVLLAKALGLVFGAGTVVVTVVASRRLWPARAAGWALTAGALLALHAGFAAWGTGALETTLFTLVALAAALAYLRAVEAGRLPAAGAVLFGVAAMTRPDAMPLFAVTTLHLLLAERRAGRRLVSRRTVGWVLLFAAVFVPWFGWRYAYYGYLLPNTAYAKVGTGTAQYLRGVRYVWRYLLLYGQVLWMLPSLVLVARVRDLARDYLALMLAAHLAFVVFVGGDGLAFSRFMVYSAPFAALLLAEGFAAFADRVRAVPVARLAAARVALATAAALAIAWTDARQALAPVLFPAHNRWYERQAELWFPGDGRSHTYRWFDNYFVDRQAAAARWLDAHAPSHATLAATPAGSIAFNTRLDVIDMLGLNDVHIAHVRVEAMGTDRAGHEKGDGRYVLSRRPDYILLGNVAVLAMPLDSATMAGKLVRRSEHEIWADPTFHREYELVVVPLASHGAFRFFSFYRRRDSAPLHTDR